MPTTVDILRALATLVARSASTVFILHFNYKYRSIERQVFIRLTTGFTEEQRRRMTTATYLLISSGLISPSCLSQITNEHLVKDGLSLEFAFNFFDTWLKDKDFASLLSNLKKAEVKKRIYILMRLLFRSSFLSS